MQVTEAKRVAGKRLAAAHLVPWSLAASRTDRDSGIRITSRHAWRGHSWCLIRRRLVGSRTRCQHVPSCVEKEH
eukprot:3157053-Prymnesium_polylepis.2